MVNLCGHDHEIDMLAQQGQRVAQAIEFCFAFLVSKQTERG